MSKAELYVFSSPTCPHCPAAKSISEEFARERDDVKLIQVVSGTGGAEKLFRKFDVMSVPTIIIRGPAHPNNIGLRGAQGKNVLAKYVDIALGKAPAIEEKRSMWSKLFFSQ